MTWEKVLTILKWITTISVSGIVIAVAFLLVIFILATALYIIPYLRKKIDLKTILKEKYENRIYIDEAKYIIADKELQEKIDLKQLEHDEVKNQIDNAKNELRKLASTLKSEDSKGKKKS